MATLLPAPHSQGHVLADVPLKTHEEEGATGGGPRGGAPGIPKRGILGWWAGAVSHTGVCLCTKARGRWGPEPKAHGKEDMKGVHAAERLENGA